MTQDPSDPSLNLNSYPAKAEAEPEPAALSSQSLHHVCLDLRNKIDHFLAQEHESSLLRSVQGRVREAIGVTDEAFQRYEYVYVSDPLVAIITIISR